MQSSMHDNERSVGQNTRIDFAAHVGCAQLAVHACHPRGIARYTLLLTRLPRWSAWELKLVQRVGQQSKVPWHLGTLTWRQWHDNNGIEKDGQHACHRRAKPALHSSARHHCATNRQHMQASTTCMVSRSDSIIAKFFLLRGHTLPTRERVAVKVTHWCTGDSLCRGAESVPRAP